MAIFRNLCVKRAIVNSQSNCSPLLWPGSTFYVFTLLYHTGLAIFELPYRFSTLNMWLISVIGWVLSHLRVHVLSLYCGFALHILMSSTCQQRKQKPLHFRHVHCFWSVLVLLAEALEMFLLLL